MHTKWLRPYELTQDRPRRVLNITQKDGANGLTAQRSSRPIAANQVLTGFTYQHMSPGGTDLVELAADATFRNVSAVTAIPTLQTLATRTYGNSLVGDAWQGADRTLNHTLARQSAPLYNQPGFMVYVFKGGTFNGSSLTTTVRDMKASDALALTLGRPIAAPQPAPNLFGLGGTATGRTTSPRPSARPPSGSAAATATGPGSTATSSWPPRTDSTHGTGGGATVHELTFR